MEESIGAFILSLCIADRIMLMIAIKKKHVFQLKSLSILCIVFYYETNGRYTTIMDKNNMKINLYIVKK